MFRFIIHLLNMWNKKKYDVPEEKLYNTTEDEEDDRDYLVTAQEFKVPAKYMIKNLPPIRHQSSIGSCAAHAAMAAYEIQLMNNSPRAYIEGSELFHYYNARVDADTFPNDTGMTLRRACTTLHKYGMAVEYSWPYDISKYNTKPNNIAYVFAKLYKVKEYYRITDIDALKEQLSQNYPVICGIWIYSNFYKQTKDNYLYKPDGSIRGGHAVTVVGYDDEKKVFILRNSWGTGWGNKGYFEMSYDAFVQYTFDWWIILI